MYRRRKPVLLPTCSWMGVCTMFIGYSLQATLEQINRKGLLQGRIENVRVYSGQGMRRTCTLPPRWLHRSSAREYFLISLPFFSRKLAATTAEAVLQRSTRSHDMAFELSSILNLRAPRGTLHSAERKLSTKLYARSF